METNQETNELKYIFYEGDFEKGKKHGHGKFINEITNESYEGNFVNDIINGNKLPLLQFLYVTKDKFLTKSNYNF